MKSGNLNFLEPSGPLQACNGTTLPYCITQQDGSYQNYFRLLNLCAKHSASQSNTRTVLLYFPVVESWFYFLLWTWMQIFC